MIDFVSDETVAEGANCVPRSQRDVTGKRRAAGVPNGRYWTINRLAEWKVNSSRMKLQQLATGDKQAEWMAEIVQSWSCRIDKNGSVPFRMDLSWRLKRDAENNSEFFLYKIYCVHPNLHI